jgi:S1-C subfamily serine protease
MQRKAWVYGGLAALMLVPAGTALAQQREREEAVRDRQQELEKARRAMSSMAYAFATDDRERPRLGVSTQTSGKRDTLGLLVSDVTADGPAAKAGIEEGDRIQSINGVNLRLAREDAGEEDMEGVATRRLIRALGNAKIGDEVELRVLSNGSVKTVKVKTVSVEDLEGRHFGQMEADNRAALGVGIGSSGSRRDTLGILIASVSDDSPADKAGLIEGDRLQSINGVDLRVPAEDAGDRGMSSSRVRRLTRELEKLKPGDDVELRVYSGGTTKSVRLKAVKASEVKDHGGFYFGDMPGAMAFPNRMVMPRIQGAPNIIRYRSPQGGAIQLKQDFAPRRLLPKVAPASAAKIRRVITI